eukprot:1996422-Pleurochrysis_carterae.AAC.2
MRTQRIRCVLLCPGLRERPSRLLLHRFILVDATTARARPSLAAAASRLSSISRRQEAGSSGVSSLEHALGSPSPRACSFETVDQNCEH